MYSLNLKVSEENWTSSEIFLPMLFTNSQNKDSFWIRQKVYYMPVFECRGSSEVWEGRAGPPVQVCTAQSTIILGKPQKKFILHYTKLLGEGLTT